MTHPTVPTITSRSRLHDHTRSASHSEGSRGNSLAVWAATAPGGAVTYWHVDDLTATVQTLIAMGATEYEPVTARGEFTTASVVDPFGNVLGVMHNPHYLNVLAARTKA